MYISLIETSMEQGSSRMNAIRDPLAYVLGRRRAEFHLTMSRASVYRPLQNRCLHATFMMVKISNLHFPWKADFEVHYPGACRIS